MAAHSRLNCSVTFQFERSVACQPQQTPKPLIVVTMFGQAWSGADVMMNI
jgi:hypothetical protein